MTGHVDPETLVAYADGALDPPRAETARSHIAGCDECRSQLDDLRAVQDLVQDSDENAAGSSSEDGIPPSLDAALDRVIHDQVRGGPSRFGGWRAAFLPAAVAAAVAGIWLALRNPVTDRPAPLNLRGATIVTRGAGDLRGPADDTIHFEISLDAPAHLAIFSVAGSSVEILYPHPNPVLGSFGRTTPFEKGRAHRVPPTPIADYPAPATRPEPVFLAVPTSELESAATLAPVLADLRAAAPSGLEAVRERLRARFGSVADLERR